MNRPYFNAIDYYEANEEEWRDPQLIAMLALTDALIDHRRAIKEEGYEYRQQLEREGKETREELRRLAREINQEGRR